MQQAAAGLQMWRSDQHTAAAISEHSSSSPQQQQSTEQQQPVAVLAGLRR